MPPPVVAGPVDCLGFPWERRRIGAFRFCLPEGDVSATGREGFAGWPVLLDPLVEIPDDFLDLGAIRGHTLQSGTKLTTKARL